MTADPKRSRTLRPENLDEDRLVTENLGLVYDLAAKYQRPGGVGPERGDLVSAGVRGLIQAAGTFDPSRGLSFSTLAVARIRGEMLDELRRWDHIPRSVRQKERQIRASEAALSARLKRQPSAAEVAEELDMSQEQLHGWYLDLARHVGESLDDTPAASIYEARRLGGEALTEETNEVIERLGREEAVGVLAGCIEKLPEREARVLALYYFEGLRLREIAQVLGVTESRISQIRHAALKKLRVLLIQHGVEP
jgi:RNA polymerase sigma factor for flagellar operon FliA